MAAELTKQQRDALRPEDFAVPGQRKLPIRNTPDDKQHVRMAWNMVDRVQALSTEERAAARQSIQKRAQELGLDTREWRTIQAMSIVLEAMSLEVPEVEDHPNRAPFKGVLTYLDQASDHPPGGSGGKRVIMTKASAEKALPSLLGMGVDLTENLDGHDAQKKIGVITGADIEENAIVIAGFLYEADFPEEVRRIQASKARLGWSYEIQRVIVEDMSADPLVITDFVFTGAAILRKDKAAYSETSLSARADKDHDMTKEELEALNKAVNGMVAGLEALTKDVAAIKAAGGTGGRIDAASVNALVKPHADAIRSVASKMEASGIGTHNREGHVLLLNRMADHMEAESMLGRMPHIYRDHDYFVHARSVEAAAADASSPALKAVSEKVEAFGKQVTDIAGTVSTAIADMKAAATRMEAASKGAGGGDRKTLPAHVAHLLTKNGITVEAAQGMDVHTLDTALEKAGIKRQDCFKIKLALNHSGAFQHQQAS
jgi:hypothetical protein